MKLIFPVAYSLIPSCLWNTAHNTQPKKKVVQKEKSYEFDYVQGE